MILGKIRNRCAFSTELKKWLLGSDPAYGFQSYSQKSERNFQIITSGPGVNSMTHTLKNAQILNFEPKSAPGLFIRIFSKFAITYIDTSSSRKDPKKYFQIITSGPGVNSMTHTVKTRFSNLKFSHKFYFSKIIFFTIILRIFQRSF